MKFQSEGQRVQNPVVVRARPCKQTVNESAEKSGESRHSKREDELVRMLGLSTSSLHCIILIMYNVHVHLE